MAEALAAMSFLDKWRPLPDNYQRFPAPAKAKNLGNWDVPVLIEIQGKMELCLKNLLSKWTKRI